MNSKLMHVTRVLLGFIFLVAGVNGYFEILGFETFAPTSDAAMALFEFKYLLVVEKSLEVICALLLLSNRFVPLALITLAPLIVNILLIHIFLDPSLLVLAIVLVILEGYLIYYYRDNFVRIFEKTPTS